MKSKIVYVDNVGDVEGLARILGYRVSYLPMKYFDLSLGVSYMATSIWNGIIAKMECLLTGWKRVKRLYLSKACD